MGSIHHAAEIIYMCIHSSEEIIYTAECSKVMGNMQICLRFDQVFVEERGEPSPSAREFIDDNLA